MATANEFIARISAIEGVEGCLLVRDDGQLLAQSIEDAETYSSLLVISGGYAREIMLKAGFSYCRFLSFRCEGNQNFHVFPIDRYFLGVVQSPDCRLSEMIDNVTQLVSRVIKGRVESQESPKEAGGGHAPES